MNAAADAPQSAGGVCVATRSAAMREPRGEFPAGKNALEARCRTYWRPVYDFVRQFGITEMMGERLVLATVCIAVMWSNSIMAQTREEAVLQAREGHIEDAIAALRRLLEENSQDAMTAFDLAVILTWAQRPREATQTFERAAPSAEPPQYVLEPIIRAYRDQKRFTEAEHWAREATARYPADPSGQKLLSLVLIDENRPNEAIALLKPLTVAYPDDPEVWLALGYASRVAKDPFATLRNYGQALRLQPDNREAAEAMASVLSDLGAPFGASALWPEAPKSLRASQAGLLVRWGENLTSRDPRRRFEGTDVALARLEKLLREARSRKHPDRELIFRLRCDQVKALRNREHWAETVDAAEKLRADGDILPPYVIEAEADALLALRQPTKARACYEAVLHAEPTNRNARTGRFYCLVEEEKLRDAFREIDALVASEQPGTRLPRQSTIEPNDDWLADKLLAAEARSFADMESAAWDRLLPLANAAPANAELRRVEGDLAAARGWPRRGDEEIHIAASLAPEDKGVQLALAETAMRRMRWDEARERIGDLETLYPDDVAIQRAKRDLDAHDSFELQTDFVYRHEYSGPDGIVSGSSPGSGTEARAWLFAPPVDDRWRFFAAWERYDAEVTEGLALRYREGAGVELRLADVTAMVTGWQNDGSISQLGADLAVSWQPTDHWTFSLDGSYFAADTPLRAVLNQITANSAGGAIQYAWHESRSLRFYAHWYDFSDGNERVSGGLTLDQKIVDIPHLDVTLRPEVYASGNSSNQGPYFSPLRDFACSVTIDTEHMLWRRYEHVFSHRLALTGGSYWEKNFGSDWTGNIRYEQVWQNNPWLELRWGVQLNRAVYDGDVTPSLETFIRLNWRF
jgi:biofilm PGA synthesis protein PgaA